MLLKILHGFTIAHRHRKSLQYLPRPHDRLLPLQTDPFSYFPSHCLLLHLTPPWPWIIAVPPTHRHSACLVPCAWNILPLDKAYSLQTPSLLSVSSFLNSLFERARLTAHHAHSLTVPFYCLAWLHRTYPLLTFFHQVGRLLPIEWIHSNFYLVNTLIP